MAAKGVISGVIPWEQSRAFFYHRLVRRLAEFKIRRSIIKAAPEKFESGKAASALLRTWLQVRPFVHLLLCSLRRPPLTPPPFIFPSAPTVALALAG